MYKTIEEARRNQDNPMEMFKQATSKYTLEQLDAFYKQIEMMGVSPDVINQLKEGINSE